MAEGKTRSLQAIRYETEQTRAGLTNTVDQLRSTVTDTATEIRDRLRPDAIRAEVSGYIRSRGETLVHDITEAARRNPMQAVAVSASVAYPLMRFARAIPLPVLMIGAGLFFAGSKTGRDLTQTASDMAGDLADETRRRVQDIGDQASQAVSGAKEYATDAVGRAKLKGKGERLRSAGANAMEAVQGGVASNIQGLRNTASGGGTSISDQIGNLKEKTVIAAQSAAARVGEMASGASDTVGTVATNTARRGRDLLSTTRQQVSDAGQKATRTTRETVEQNPLLVAGVGLFIGGLIASALPKLQMEESVMGDASNAVRERARQAAAKGFETAKDAAGEILTNVAQKAEAEGLTPDGVARGLQDVGQRLQRVDERGITTAFEPDQSQENQSQGNGGVKEHG